MRCVLIMLYYSVILFFVCFTEEYFAGSPASLTRSLSPNAINNTNDTDAGSRLYHLVRLPQSVI